MDTKTAIFDYWLKDNPKAYTTILKLADKYEKEGYTKHEFINKILKPFLLDLAERCTDKFKDPSAPLFLELLEESIININYNQVLKKAGIW